MNVGTIVLCGATPRPNRRLTQGWALSLLLVFVCLAGSSPASATYDPLGTGKTNLRFDHSFLHFLTANGVTISARAPAALRPPGALTLPVSGGEFDPTTGKGTIESEGALLFRRAGRTLPIRQIVLKANHSPLLAKVGGSRLKLATSSGLSARRRGFGATLTATDLKLSAKLATRLDKKLGLPRDAFTAGRPLGTISSNPLPLTTAILPTGRATFTPDSAFLAKLGSHFVSLNPIAPAELAPGPLLSFPLIPGGRLAPDGSEGTLLSGGSLEFLQLGGGQVFWHEQWLDLGARVLTAEVNIQPAPPYPGKLGRITLLDLTPTATSADPESRTITLQGALTLTPSTAAQFNQAFASGAQVFISGEVLGAVSFLAQGQ